MSLITQDGAGNEDPTRPWVTFTVSDQPQDVIGPDATVALPAADVTYQLAGFTGFSGSATDDVGVGEVEVAVKNRDLTQWWNGTGWQAGAELPADAGRVVAAIKQAAVAAGRTIDEDHYGAAFPFYFGSRDDGVVSGAMTAYQKRTGREPAHYFAIGDEETILARVAEYVAAGVEKFILRPVGPDGEAILAQTRKLIEKVLPQVETRWPKRAVAA